MARSFTHSEMTRDIQASTFSNPWGGESSPTDTKEEVARKLSNPTVVGGFDTMATSVLSSSFQSPTLHTAQFEGIFSNTPSQPSLVDGLHIDPWTGSRGDISNSLSQSDMAGYEKYRIDSVSDSTVARPESFGRVESPQDVVDSYHNVITVLLSPQEKSIFSPTNYSITSSVHNTTVLRRYSDFLWLQDILLLKYPFRIITALPPKKAVGASGVFLEQRRKGLQRFLHSTGNHPNLRSDEIVVLFLTSTDSIQHIKSTYSLDMDEEGTSVPISPDMMAHVPLEFEQTIQSFNPTLQTQLQDICTICTTLERIIQQVSATMREMTVLARLVRKTCLKSDCVFQDCREGAALEERVEIVQEGMEQIDTTMNQHQEMIESVMLERLKEYRDVLAGYQIMLGRRHIHLASISIQLTTKRISANKNRLVELTARNSPQRELDRVAQLIDQVRVLIDLG
jgi:hypothetical protein